MKEKEYLEIIKCWKEEHKDLILSGKCKKMFIECLPTKNKSIDWENSSGIQVYFIYNDIEGFINIISSKCNSVLIQYNDGEIFNITSTNFKYCKIGNILNVNTSNFKLKIGDTIKDIKRDLIIIDKAKRPRITKSGKISNDKWYKYHCNKCGAELWVVESSLLTSKSGCACCNGKTVIEGINDIPTTEPWMVKYFQGGYEEAIKYNSNSTKTIYPVCPDCGKIKNKKIKIQTIYKKHSIGCNCSDNKSKISKFVFNILDHYQHQKQFEYFDPELKYDWNKYKKLDGTEHQAFIDYVVHIGNRSIPIECDGGFHRTSNNMSGQTLEEVIFIDKQRDKNCLLNLKEETIRISDDGDFKENVLNSKLNYIFNLNNIEWNYAFEFCYSNLLKKACYLKNQNENFTARDISKMLFVDRTTIRRWLKIGNKIGWCNYNPKEEIIKNGKRSCIRINKQYSSTV